MKLKVCAEPGCPDLTTNVRCTAHTVDRGTTTERGLGWDHQKRRAKLMQFAIGTICELCGELILPGQKLHLDHSTPRAHGGQHGDRIVHGECNDRAGATVRSMIFDDS